MKRKRDIKATLADVFQDLLERQNETIEALYNEDYNTALTGALDDRDRIRQLLNTSLKVPGSPSSGYFDGERSNGGEQ